MFYYYYIPHYYGAIFPPGTGGYNYIPIYRPRRR